MKRKYPLIFIIIVLSVILWMSPVFADNEDLNGTLGDTGFTYCLTLSEQTSRLIISGQGDIPSVDEMDDYFYDTIRDRTQAIVIEEGITSIGDRVFIDFYNADEISLPKSLKSIGEYAFAGCSDLQTITIPSGVNDLDSAAFAACPNLHTVKVSSSNKTYTAKNNIILTDGGKTVCYIASGMKTEVNIPSGVTKIPAGIFDGMSSYPDTLILPASVTEIEGTVLENGTVEYPFRRFSSVKINSSNKVYESYKGCVYDKKNKVLLWIPWSGSGTFTVKDGTKTAAAGVFDSLDMCAFTKISFPESFEGIYGVDFRGVTGLKTIELRGNNPYYKLKNGIVYSKDEKKIVLMFSNKNNDSSFLDGVEVVMPYAVLGGEVKEGNLVIPESVKYIGDQAFRGLYLNTVVVKGNVDYIGSRALDDAKGIIFEKNAPAEIYVKGEHGSFGDSNNLCIFCYDGTEGWSTPLWHGYNCVVFGGWQNLNENISWFFDETTKTLTIKGTGEMPAGPFGWAKINESLGVENLVISDGITSVAEGAFSRFESLEKASVPESVTKIGKRAFYSCSKLEEINIPSKVTRIEEQTFNGCSKIKEIVIPDGVTFIDREAFMSMSSLEKVVIPAGVEYIGFRGFHSCTSLKEIVFKGAVKHIGETSFSDNTAMKELIIPEGVEVIGFNAFSGYQALEKLTIPSTLKEIPSRCFSGSYALKEVTISEGVEIISSNAFWECRSLTSIIIPASIKEISNNAFEDVTSLKEVYFVGRAPVSAGNASAPNFFEKDVVIYYVDGKAGWSSPSWYGYETRLWDGGGMAVVDHEDVEYMIDFIDDLGIEDITEIDRAKKFYEALSDEEKSRVTNYDLLVLAEDRIREKMENAVSGLIEKINGIGEDVLSEKDKITEAMAIYDSLGSYKDKVTNYDILKVKYDELMSYNAGDVNGDGKINALDATQILRYANNKPSVLDSLSEADAVVKADVNKDGKINALDATQILRYANNKPSVLDENK